MAAAAGGRAATQDLSPAQDARILDFPGYLDVNFRNDILSVYTAAGNVQRSLIQFDLGGVELEPGQRLESATLVLRASTGFGLSNNKPMRVYRVVGPWDEASVTWNRASTLTPWLNAGGDFTGGGGSRDGQAFAVSTASPGNGETVVWDVTGLVDLWLEGVAPNHGLLLLSENGNGLTFVQRESPQAADRPVMQLVIGAGPPRLLTERQEETGGAILSWRGVETAILEERPSTGSAADWADSALVPTAQAGRSIVQVPPSADARLFRLRSK